MRKHSTVALSGESADEVFGGYRWFHDPEAIQADTFPWLTSVTGKYFDGKTLFNQGLLAQLDMQVFLRDSYSQAIAEAVPVDTLAQVWTARAPEAPCCIPCGTGGGESLGTFSLSSQLL